MATKISLLLGVVSLLCGLGQTESSCSSSQIMCRSGAQCISLEHVCRSGKQCSDGSDEDPEICNFWTPNDNDKHRCNYGQYYTQHHGCQYANSCCNTPSCAARRDHRICEMVKKGKLELEQGMELTGELMLFLQQAVINSSLSNSSCPMFYTLVGDKCLSFFSPAKIPWAEARQFCLSIGGDLLTIRDLAVYDKLLQYMRMAELTTDYWIGGHYDMDNNAWSWVTDDTPMPLGSPYWATKYSDSCIPRSPPHTNPFSSPAEAVVEAPCLKYLQSPLKRTQGWCAAMTYEHYYYFSDEVCQRKKSPLCIFTKEKSHEKSEDINE